MDTIYTVSDLQRRYRAVLDAARSGLARVRDTNGESLVVIKESKLRLLEEVAAAAANLAQIESALAIEPAGALSVASYGDWTWLRSLDRDDLSSFRHDIRQAIIVGQREGSTALLHAELAAWRTTAEELDDPLRRSILLGPVRLEDFVPLPRPEADPSVG